MRYGAHLPLADLDGRGVAGLASYARTAAELGFDTLAANDHLVFSRPWPDGIVALASVVEASGELTLATTAALPVVRGPAQLAKTAAALGIVSGGRLVLGLGPGSSPADYVLAGIDFEERWPRFDTAVRAVRSHLDSLEPRPVRRPPIGRRPGRGQPEPGRACVLRLLDPALHAASLSQPVGAALGTQAGPARIRTVTEEAGFTRFRLAAQTLFDNVYEVRP